MRRPEAGQCIPQKRDAQHQRCQAEAAKDEVHPEEVLRRRLRQTPIFAGKQGDVETRGRKPIAEHDKAGRHDIAHGETDQHEAQHS